MQNPLLPHHKLLAYEVALQLLRAVGAAKIRDSYLRDQAEKGALRSARRLVSQLAVADPRMVSELRDLLRDDVRIELLKR